MKYYTVNEIAEMFRVTPNTVYRWTYTGKLKTSSVAGVVRISQSDLDDFLKKK